MTPVQTPTFKIPSPPKYRDPRQSAVRQVARHARDQGATRITVLTNIQTGYPASDVDVPRIRSMLERALQRTGVDWLRKHWAVVRSTIECSVDVWAQRVKHIKVTPRWRGRTAHVDFTTEDDNGTYRHEFDIALGHAAA